LYERRRETIGRAHDFTESLKKHQQIYRAIRARRPEKARRAMKEHLVLAHEAYRAEEADAARTASI
jgi:DNA-binding FadR family transcriptional regulator